MSVGSADQGGFGSVKGGGGAGGDVTGLTSADGTVTITNPGGPVPDLSVPHVVDVTAGTGIAVGGTPAHPSVSNSGVLDVTAGTGVTVGGSAQHPTVNNAGVLDVTAGTNVIVTGSAQHPIINASPGSGGTVTTVTSASPDLVITNPTTTPAITQNIAADWPIANIRVYAVDGVNGNDANAGFADAAGTSAGQYATACAAAGAVAKKTVAGLAAIFPRIGAGRIVEVVFAAGTYAGSPADFLNGCIGYATNGLLIRGTATNSTAGAVAFDGSTADATYVGGVTVAGLNAAGYNPTGTPTTSVIQLLKVGGGAPGFGARPAVPVGFRSRFDSATTTAALRNQCRQINSSSGGDTVNSGTVYGAVPVGSDVLYTEQPGLVFGGMSLSVDIAPGAVFVGCRFSSISVEGNGGDGGRIAFAFCSSDGSFASSFNNCFVANAYTHPVLGNLVVGSGLRTTTTGSFNRGFQNFSAVVVVTDLTLSTNVEVAASQIGLAARSVTIRGSNAHSTGLANSLSGPTVGSLITSVGSPYIFGGGATAGLLVDGSSCRIGQLDITGCGIRPAIKLSGKCEVAIANAVTGSTGNTDVGLDLTDSAGSLIVFSVNPTVTGTLGDIRLSAGQIVTWAQVAATGFTDSNGNRFVSLGNTPLGILKFSGGLVGQAIPISSSLADGGISSITNLVPINYPTSLRLMRRLRVSVASNSLTNAVTCTLFKNGVATAMQVTIPAGATGVFSDTTHGIVFLDGDTYDLSINDPGTDATNLLTLSAALEYCA